MNYDPNRETERIIDNSHFCRVSLSEIIVYRNDVDGIPRNRIERSSYRRYQGFSFSGSHFGDVSIMEREGSKKLYVVWNHIPYNFSSVDEGKSFSRNKDRSTPVESENFILDIIELFPNHSKIFGILKIEFTKSQTKFCHSCLNRTDRVVFLGDVLFQCSDMDELFLVLLQSLFSRVSEDFFNDAF